MTDCGHSSGEPGSGDPAAFRVLVVCTGNICRSPAVAQVLGRALSGSQSPVEVSSAGTRAVIGSGMHPLTLAALAEQGLNDSRHVARQLDSTLVERADLVLTAERAHRVPVVQVDPTAARRTFTVVEFSRLATLALGGSATGRPGDWHQLVARAASLRGTGAPANPADDDLSDPISGGPDEHRRMVERALTLVDAISGLIPA